MVNFDKIPFMYNIRNGSALFYNYDSTVIYLVITMAKRIICALIICLIALLITFSVFRYKADMYFYKGRKHLNNNSMDEAIKSYEMAVKYNPLEINYLNVLSNVYLKMAANSLNKQEPVTRQWLEKTIIVAMEVQRLYPGHYRSAFILGLAYHILDSISPKDMGATVPTFGKEAIKYYKQAIALHPLMFKLRDKLAQIYFEKGYYQVAIEELKEAIRIEPENPIPRKNFSNIQSKLKEVIK